MYHDTTMYRYSNGTEEMIFCALLGIYGWIYVILFVPNSQYAGLSSINELLLSCKKANLVLVSRFVGLGNILSNIRLAFFGRSE